MFETAKIDVLDDSTDKGKAMNEAVMGVKDAIGKFLGVEVDIAIGVHFHKEPGSSCSAMVVTPEGMPVELAAKCMWLALGGLQMIMAEMPDPGETVN